MKIVWLHLLILSLTVNTYVVQAQQFLNGSFETTNYTQCTFGLSNSGLTAHVPHLVAFGYEQGFDFLVDSCGRGSAQDGRFFLALPMAGSFLTPPIFGLKLSNPMLAGNSYTIRFYYKAGDKLTHYNKLQIGLSNVHNQFGSVIHTIDEFSDEWQAYEFQFVAAEDGQYINLKFKVGMITKVLLDNFSVDCPTSINLGNDTVLCDFSKQSLFLKPDGRFETYQWQDFSSEAEFLVEQPGTYFVSVKRDECELQDTIRVEEHPYRCRCNAFVPSAFTPNLDGINDEFRPVLDCELSNYEFAIFNRWGQLVFRSNNPGESWRGLNGSNNAPEGVYAWALKYQYTYEDFMRFEAGGLTLIR